MNDQPFTLNQVDGRIVLVEVLNVLCPHCQKQTQPYNKLFRMIEDDPVTAGRIKMLGVAVANDDEAIDDFVVIYSVRFSGGSRIALSNCTGPCAPGRPRCRSTPCATPPVLPLVVADTYLGEDHDMDELFDYLKYLLTMETADFTSLPRDKEVAQQEQLLPPQSEAEVAEMVRTSFAAQGDQIEDFRRLQLAGGRWVYAASLLRDGRPPAALRRSRQPFGNLRHLSQRSFLLRFRQQRPDPRLCASASHQVRQPLNGTKLKLIDSAAG